MRWQKIVLRASEYLPTRCEWFLRREEIRLNNVNNSDTDRKYESPHYSGD